VAAAAWVHDYAPPIRSLVLVTPALRVKLYVPLALPGLRLLRWMKGNRPAFIKSYVKARMLTHDPAEASRYDSDPLIARSIAVNVLLDMHDTSTRLIKDAGAITTPTLLLGAGRDWVVDLNAQRKFFEHLSSADKEMHTFPGMFHDLLHEADRAPVLDTIRTFLNRTYENRRLGEDLHEADKHGYTQREYDDLQCALPVTSPRRWSFALQRLMMKSLGMLSNGIRLGWATGFDSGKSLDYVYENQPRGQSIIGKMIDRTYLNSPGWRGIRQRKRHIEVLLQAAIRDTVRADRPVRILDVAAGAGRYVLETMKALPDTHIDGHLRDHDPANVEAARRLARELGVNSVIFERGNAFDEESLASIAPPPTIVIVSGLYELFPDNELVSRSLRGIARAMRESGWLIYTAQPWHPQLEMIARVLINREGKPWIMRRRTQEEMDELVHTAGFRKQWMEIDEAGIFTVSLARIETRT
jgi:SAM-dependent methyltransferase